MSEEEPRWRAALRGTLDAITERAFEKGPGVTEAGMQLLDSHVAEAERRGREAALHEAAEKIRYQGGSNVAVSEYLRGMGHAADLIDPDKEDA